ncbi:MAG: YlxM family DNA-binding protein [Firmicutes bacterium]|nr:YlxM family DNA-binding protein [Bacillota bacterium]
MDKIYEQTMLFDFYGELLTEHQRSVYIDAVYNDLSLGEIAEERGISRQGVHDLIKRCDRILRDYEEKLHLVERFARAKETVREIQELSEAVPREDLKAAETVRIPGTEETPETDGEQELRNRLRRIGELSKELLEEL